MSEVAAEEHRGSSSLYDGKGFRNNQRTTGTTFYHLSNNGQWSLISEPILTYGVSFCQDIDFAMLV